MNEITAEEIREFRILVMGMTQAEFAERMMVSKRTVEDWEGNRRSPMPYIRLAFAAMEQNLPPYSS